MGTGKRIRHSRHARDWRGAETGEARDGWKARGLCRRDRGGAGARGERRASRSSISVGLSLLEDPRAMNSARTDTSRSASDTTLRGTGRRFLPFSEQSSDSGAASKARDAAQQ